MWSLLPLGMQRECASQDCGGAAAWELEAGSVVSCYCNLCKSVIERGEKYGPKRIDLVSPPDDSWVKRAFVGDNT
jgi:hypothetical protein